MNQLETSCKKKPTLSDRRLTANPKSNQSDTKGNESINKKTALPKKFPAPSSMATKYKQAEVWSSSKCKGIFQTEYNSGSIPFRIQHGSVRNALQWMQDPSTISYDPILITCIEGFHETQHPFVFLARQGFRELMQQNDARCKTIPMLSAVVSSLRRVFLGKNEDAILMALEATELLSNVVDVELNAHLPSLLQQMHSKFRVRKLQRVVEQALHAFIRNGGKDAMVMIQRKIPTISCIN